MPTRYLNPGRVLSGNLDAVMPPPAGKTWTLPESQLLRQEAREALRAVEPDDTAYQAACDRFEFLTSLIAISRTEKLWPGLYLLGSHWGDEERGLAAAIRNEISPDWPLIRAGALDNEEAARTAYQTLAERRSQNGFF